ncbi:MAG: trifunctional serine/threonine-protein kinase/ATP-binding protein/sensor histidine kinase [Sporichthyaceae bacterium]
MTTTVAGYRVLETLAASDSRMLLRAVDPDGTPVVLKVLAADRTTPADVARLRHELAVAADLPDEFVVRPVRTAEFGAGVGLVLPDHGGVALSSLIPPDGFDTTTLLRVAGSIAEAVGAVHAAGLLHRDLKPDNLLADPDLSWVRVADFGLAIRLALVAAPESPVGTLAYLAPEQTGRMNRTVDARSDLYSFGVTLYQIATGRLPFQMAGALETVHAHLAASPADPRVLRPDLPEPVAAMILRLLAKQPEDRYQSAVGVLHDLRLAAEGWAAAGKVEDFALGEADVVVRARVPDRLFGRDGELAVLTEALGEAAAGRGRLVRLPGGPGVGKSALVAELAPAIAAANGRFAVRKYDQYARGFNPPTALIEHVARQLLREPAEVIAWWRKRLQDLVGGQLSVLVDLAPDLARIVGEQPPPAPLGPAESQQRTIGAIATLFDAFGAPGAPFVFFLDDVQWANQGNVDLMTATFAADRCRNNLVLAAYRPGEVDETHPFARMVAGLEPERVLRIELGALDSAASADLVTATLGAPEPELARRLHTLTEGNPFFLRQVLGSLILDGNPVEAEVNVSGDVVEFLLGRLADLPVETRQALQVAAPIGNLFTLDLLATARGLTGEQTARALAPAVAAGLLSSPADAGPERYRFVHDRVQQAAYATIAAGDLPRLHLRIGTLLRARLSEDPALLFPVVAHLNAAGDLVAERGDRHDLAGLNAKAAAAARAGSGFDAAAGFLAAAERLLGGEDQALGFEVALSAAEVLSVLGRREDSERAFELALRRAPDADAAGNVRAAQSEARFTVNDIPGAYEAARAGLEAFGISIGGAPANLEGLAPLLDPAMLDGLRRAGPGDEHAGVVGRLLAAAMIAAYVGGRPELSECLVKCVEHTVASGVTAGTGVPLAYVGMQMARNGQLGLALDYARAGMELVAEQGDLARGPAETLAWCYTLGWTADLAEQVAVYRANFRRCQDSGAFIMANYSVCCEGFVRSHQADVPTMVETWERVAEHGRTFAPQMVPLLELIVRSTRRLSGEPFDRDALEATAAAYEAAGSTFGALILWHILGTDVLLGDYAWGLRATVQARELLAASGGTPTGSWMIEAEIGEAVCASHLAMRTTDLAHRADLLAQAHAAADRFRPFAELEPRPYVCYLRIADGALARAQGDSAVAAAHFEAARQDALRVGNTLVAAWAAEFLGRVHVDRGRRIGRAHLIEARTLYAGAGASAKVAALDAEFPDLATDGAAGPDLAAVLAASQEIAAQVSPDRVVSAFVAAAIAATGATGGAFVSPGAPVPAGTLEFPLLHKGELLGTLVLDRATAFGPEASTVLDLLAPQVGISWENARLYADLEAKVADRTAALQATMTQRSAMQDQIVQSEKLAALGGLVAGVAHEINNPIGVALSASSHLVARTADFRAAWSGDKLRRSELDDFVRTAADAAEIILSNADRAAGLVASFKQVAVDQAAEARREFALGPYLADVVASLTPKLRHTPHRVEIDLDPDLRLVGYPGAVAQVATNLVLNSLLHGYPPDHPGGTIRFGGARHGAGIRLTYSDDGVGVPAEDLPRIFDAFFTTRRGAGGSGLGLHIVHNLVTQRLAGTIAVHSEPGHGTTFVMDLPTHPEGSDV